MHGACRGTLSLAGGWGGQAKAQTRRTQAIRVPHRQILASHRTRNLRLLVMIAVTDVIFAVDSIPAIFAISTDPFIVLTSNMFAVRGLRAMFFLLGVVVAIIGTTVLLSLKRPAVVAR